MNDTLYVFGGFNFINNLSSIEVVNIKEQILSLNPNDKKYELVAAKVIELPSNVLLSSTYPLMTPISQNELAIFGGVH